ncbi:hypothetical protein AB0E62_27360 [Streptomyces sp. NPDC038707]|uniref:hypothetical protein n=1 Tax=Streptomyces sp. NPDC038707 TaxID=3154329 RepID=UPI0033FAB843
MSALPEQYQRYTQPGQPLRPAGIELHDDRDPVAWVPNAYGEMVPMRRSQLQPVAPAEPRDMTRQPVLDPLAQRMLAGGLGVGAAGAGVGFGLGQLAAGVTMMGTSGLAILVVLLLAASSLRGRSVVNVRNTTHVHQQWFGRTDVKNGS